MTDAHWRREAMEAWDAEVRRLTMTSPVAIVLAMAIATFAFTIVAVALRLSLLFADRSSAIVTMSAGVALAIALIAAPLAIVRRRASRARAVIDAARRARPSAGCPRCDAPLLARGEDEAGERRCTCGAKLLEAEGLLVVSTSEPHFRRMRWRAQARARLGIDARVRGEWTLSPLLWTSIAIAALAALWTTAAALGGAPPSTIEAPLALDRQVSMHGTARAASEPAPLPAGPTTRRRAPAWVGTQALAPYGTGPRYGLAVIVSVDSPRAFVVHADGESAWVLARDLLAPELAPGDAIELAEGASFVPAELVDRVGPMLRVRSGDEERWTSAARVRVRSDARHRSGEGLESDIPTGAWIEARIDGVLRPGLQVDTARDQHTVLVVLSDGSARWVPRSDVRAQQIGPGARVWVDGRPRPMIVAARIGDALAVVDRGGARSWTSLARVRRMVAR